MRAFAGYVLTALLLSGPCLGQDLKRLSLRQDLLGLEAVGRVEVGENGYCTGTLIAPDLVLTAAHCIVDDDGPFDPAVLRFRAGLRDGRSVAESAVARSVADASYDPQETDGAARVSADLALLELAEPIPAATAAPFRVAHLNGSLRSVGVVSFARGRDAAPSRQAECGVIGRRDRLIAFDCDVDFGSSGAPVFDRSGNRPVIVSIISGGYRDEGKPISFGMTLPGAVDRLRQALRTGRGVNVAGTSTTADGFAARRIVPGGGTNSAGSGARFIRP
ncbi:serine protease [Defluviimonas aestuarii]|uniref:trypsin-like serine peptidase n=1 Tax=Albidovulum aestuarii TaxID=1130726 RepID=UPI002499CE2B|nr:serine protease [Defluviimonas aestuarii]MDI3336733.1 serine protease [Defluviimonas aestuarii]